MCVWLEMCVSVTFCTMQAHLGFLYTLLELFMGASRDTAAMWEA